MATSPIKINRRSANITEGKSRAPNRSMYYAMGYQEGDFVKPMVGVANGHSTITPCNSGLQKLADAAVAGIEEAGGNAQIFGTPTISDGMAMGTEGMKYSLVSREVISDCIETCVQGQWMDGVLAMVEEKGSDMPKASKEEDMVLAVYMPPQDPVPGMARISISRKSASLSLPAAFSPTASKTLTMLRSLPL